MINWSAVWKEVRERKFSLIAYSLSMVGVIWMYTALFPSLHSQLQNYNKILESIPKAFQQAFNIDSSFMASIEGYLSTELFSFTWPLLAMFFVISRAGSSLAGEIEKGTIGTMLSQPLSRTKLYWSKYTAGIGAFIVFTLITILAIIPLAAIYSSSLAIHHLLPLSGLCLLFGAAVYSLAMLISATTSDKSKVYGVTGAILVAMYITNIVSGIRPSLGWLKYTSAFHYFNATSALVHGQTNWSAYAVFASTVLIFSALGAVWFKNRDLI